MTLHFFFFDRDFVKREEHGSGRVSSQWKAAGWKAGVHHTGDGGTPGEQGEVGVDGQTFTRRGGEAQSRCCSRCASGEVQDQGCAWTWSVSGLGSGKAWCHTELLQLLRWISLEGKVGTEPSVYSQTGGDIEVTGCCNWQVHVWTRCPPRPSLIW